MPVPVAIADAAFAPIPATLEEFSDPSSAPARELYSRVMEEVRRGEYATARAGLARYVELYPDSPLTPKAEYWLGECDFQLGRYHAAIGSFDQALAHTPLPHKLAAAAFLRKGMSYARLGETHRSRHLFELLVAQFPDTQEALLARKSLLLP